MKKTLKTIAVLGLVFGGALTIATAQSKGAFADVKQIVPTQQVEVKEVSKNQLTSDKFNPFKSTYVFGSIGGTTNGKSSTVTTIGVGQDIFYFADKHVILGVEGAFTHFTGKRLDSVNNQGAKNGYAVVDEKNLIELGAKLSYQFNEIDPLNVRVFGKAGIASSTLKNTNQISPYVGGGVEFNVDGSNLVWVAEVKHYTDLRKAKVYYSQGAGSNFNTRKDNTVASIGIQYRF